MLRIWSTLSASTSSTVCVATDTDDERLVVKAVSRATVNNDNRTGQQLLRERCVLEQLSHHAHPNIVAYFRFCHDAQTFYICMEHVGGGDLFTKLARTGPMPEASVRRPAAEICAALGHIHSLDLVHLDVKSENIVITEQGQYKLADFGSCVRLRRPADGNGPPPAALSGLIGTPEMMAPEVINCQPIHQTADWWSYGCLLSEMLTGDSPFYNANDTDVIQLLGRTLHAELTFLDAFEFSDALVALIRALLTCEPSLRLGARPQGQAAVAGHAWFAAEPLSQSTVPAAAAPPPAPQETEDANGQQLAQVHALPTHPFTLVDAEMPTGEELMTSLLALSQPVVVEVQALNCASSA